MRKVLKQSVSLFERPRQGERAVLVHVDLGKKEPEALFEFQELARSAGAISVTVVTSSRAKPDPKYFIGNGKVTEISQLIHLYHVQLIIVNHDLSPAQERNLEQTLKTRVVDRTGLILDIFAQRARTFEGKLQVELAQLQHLATRLVRGWTHLERQKGGIGLRGPGETQLESDRRLVRNRIRVINQRLQKVQLQRAQNRKARHRAAIPTVAIVGYTNAGKSTLFNCLTKSQVYTADKLFATLDPTLRRIQLPEVKTVIIADTVGFIRHLPHDLVEAFKATLEEACKADLLLHVIDTTHAERQVFIEAVNEVLQQIGADAVPQLQICNKIDLQEHFSPRIDRDDEGKPTRVWLSAMTGEGMDLLQQALVELLRPEMITCSLKLLASEGKLRAELYAMQVIKQERELEGGGWEVLIHMPKEDFLRLRMVENPP